MMTLLNVPLATTALLLFLYFTVSLALVIWRIVAPDSSFDARIGTVLAFIAFSIATLAAIGWFSHVAKKRKIRLILWRSGVLARFVFFATAIILFSEVVFRTTGGLLTVFSIPILSRLDYLTVLLVPACLFFPLLTQLLSVAVMHLCLSRPTTTADK